MWIFRKKDRSIGYLKFADDLETYKQTRRNELEQIVRSNTLSMVNNILYPYVRKMYLMQLPEAIRAERYKTVQPLMILIRYRLNELFYGFIQANGFQDLFTDSKAIQVYYWKKTSVILEAIEELFCRFIGYDEIMEKMQLFNQEQKACIALNTQIYESLAKPFDDTRPSATGVMTQIIQHELSTKSRIAELRDDPFDIYHRYEA